MIISWFHFLFFKVNDDHARGNYELARKNASTAKGYAIAAIITGTIATIIVVILNIVAGSSTHRSY